MSHGGSHKFDHTNADAEKNVDHSFDFILFLALFIGPVPSQGESFSPVCHCCCYRCDFLFPFATMLHSLLSLSIFFLSTAFGCAPHNNHLAHAHLGKRQLVRSDANKAPKDWNYDHSADWATIKPGKSINRSYLPQLPVTMILSSSPCLVLWGLYSQMVVYS